MHSAFEPAIKAAPKLDIGRRQIGFQQPWIRIAPIERVEKLVQVRGNMAPERISPLRQLQRKFNFGRNKIVQNFVCYLEIEAILFTVADECAVLARIDVVVKMQQKALAKLKRLQGMLFN